MFLSSLHFMDGEGVRLQPELQIFFWKKKKPCKISHFLPRLDKWLHSCFPFKQSSLWTWACRALTSLFKSLSCVYWAAGGLSHTPSPPPPSRLPLWKPCVWTKDGGRYTKEACVGPYPGWAVLLPDWACAWAWQTYLLSRKYKHVSRLPSQWAFF